MNRMTRAAVAGALAAAVALGVTAPGAVAAPKAEHKASKAHKPVKAARAGHVKDAEADRKAALAERKITREAARKHAYLTRLVDSRKVSRLEDEVEKALVTNIEGDLGELRTVIEAATVTADDRADVRAIRPEVYHTIINQLRLATGVEESAADLAQGDLVAALVGLLVTFDGETSRQELREAQKMLSLALDAADSDESADSEEGADSDSDEADDEADDDTDDDSDQVDDDTDEVDGDDD